MGANNSKLITVSFALGAFLVGFTVHLLLQAFAGAFGFVARMNEMDIVKHGFPVAVGFALFLSLQLNKKSVSFADAVLGELKKVVWPSRKDTVAMTIACLSMVFLSSIVIASFDFISALVLKTLVR